MAALVKLVLSLALVVTALALAVVVVKLAIFTVVVAAIAFGAMYVLAFCRAFARRLRARSPERAAPARMLVR